MRAFVPIVAMSAFGGAIVAACASFSSSNDAAPGDDASADAPAQDVVDAAASDAPSLYVFGGYVDGGKTPTDEALAASLADEHSPGAFALLSMKLPIPLGGAVAARLGDEIVLVAGGFSTGYSTKVFHTSDVAAGWSTAPSLPIPRRGFAASSDGTDLVLLGGTTNEIDPVSGFPDILVMKAAPGGGLLPWTSTGKYQDTNVYGALAVVSGSVVVAGGIDQARVSTVRTAQLAGDAIPIDDAGINAVFADEPSLPNVIANAALGVVDDELFVIGGTNEEDSVANVSRATVGRDGSISAWEIAAPLPQAEGTPCAVSYGQSIYVVGGAQVWVGTVGGAGDLDWKPGPSLPSARSGAACVVR